MSVINIVKCSNCKKVYCSAKCKKSDKHRKTCSFIPVQKDVKLKISREVNEVLHGDEINFPIWECEDGTFLPLANPERVEYILSRFIAVKRKEHQALLPSDPNLIQTGHFEMYYKDYVEFAQACLDGDLSKTYWVQDDDIEDEQWGVHLRAERRSKYVPIIVRIEVPEESQKFTGGYVNFSYHRFHEIKLFE